LFVTGGLFAWWRLKRDSVHQQDRQVLSVAELELHAIAMEDGDLYMSLQDPADPAWQDIQGVNFAAGMAILPPAPGLEVVDVGIARPRTFGDTARVELTVTARSLEGEQSSFSAVRFYRRASDGGWVHALPESDYPGGIRVWVGENVRLVGYDVDAEWLGPAASHLEGTGSTLCRRFECRDEQSPITIAFTGTVAGPADPGAELPAPFLAGRPVDESSRSQWYAALDEYLFDEILARETGITEAVLSDKPQSIVLITRGLYEWVLSRTVPGSSIVLDTQSVRDVLESGDWITLAEIDRLAGSKPEDELLLVQVDLLIHFVDANHSERGITDLLRAVPESESLSGLLKRAFGYDLATLEELYLAFARIMADYPSSGEPE
jgi:hypothetical protein